MTKDNTTDQVSQEITLQQEHITTIKKEDNDMEKVSKEKLRDDTPQQEHLPTLTKENNTDQVSQDSDEAQQPTPFQVVLVDLKKAASKGEIHCVEKTLMGDHDLKFVAVSYRWGELHETMVDTHLGYMAHITSFDLHSFLVLCRTMATERDLKDMDYVWIDAICVDQINPVRRKATIYQMTNIYDRANYIVAVPDLHLQYLKDTNKKIANIIQGSMDHRQYLYHLINGDFEQLEHCDKAFLDTHKVPDDPHLCHLLINYTGHFAPGFILCQHHNDKYDAKAALNHIYETNAASRSKIKHHRVSKACRKVLHRLGYKKVDPTTVGIAELHKCDNAAGCPLDLFYHHNTHDEAHDGDDAVPQQDHTLEEDAWKQRIPERSACIRQSMDFLADLVQDWSTRVWVISEYNIAKKKSPKMKYWFIQLSGPTFMTSPFPSSQFVFFEIDFDDVFCGGGGHHGPLDGIISDAASSTISLTSCASEISNRTTHKSNAVYRTFHDTIQHQVNQQTFLEMMLKSKASRNADRFHAILPSSEYKSKLTSKEQVDEWQIHTLCSVKLQLYQWMSMKHKVELFFLSGNAVAANNSTSKLIKEILPSFATSKIHWPPSHSYPTLEDDRYECNFDLMDPSTLQLVPLHGASNAYKLHALPKEYYTSRNYYHVNKEYIDVHEAPLLRRLLKLNIPDKDTLDLVCIPHFGRDAIERYEDYPDWITHHVLLVGCFVKNKWIMKHRPMIDSLLSNSKWQHHYIRDHQSGFDIY